MAHEVDEHAVSDGPAWPGQDNTPTTEREIRGFYSYGVAAEVFAVVGVGAFLPVTLEQLARENGVLYSDRSTACVSSTSQRLLTRDERDPSQCVINLFGNDITTASFAMYTFSLAVLCQAVMLVSFSSFADYGDNRKRLLLTFGTVGALTSCAFILVVPAIYLVGALLVIVGITCLGSSFVVLNSFLPVLAANHPEARQATKPNGGQENDIGQKATSVELRISTDISSHAIGLGYAAAVLVQVLGISIIVIMKMIFGDALSSTISFRLILFLAGAWWLVFMIPTALWLRKRPGPPMQAINTRGRSKIWTAISVVKFAWISLWHTIQTAVRLRQMVFFLLAWFLLSDAQASVSGTAVLFARTELKIGSIGIAMISITVMVSGVLGAILIPSLQKRMGWSGPQTIIACLVLLECIPLYGLLGYLMAIQKLGVGGLQQWWEIYPCAFVFGAVMAGLSSYCRAVFGNLIPTAKETAFFGLFVVVDKGSSAIGPAIVGRIVDVTGNIRPAFLFLAIIVALPIPLIWMVDVEKGKNDARALGKPVGGSMELRDRRGGDQEEVEGLMREQDEN